MQKRIFTFLFLIATVLSYSGYAEAALQFLPRYQGGYGVRTQEGGKDKVCSVSYKYTCSGTGYAGGLGTACGGKYQSCVCAANYKWSGGSCVLKNCSDYGYSASKDTTKSCEEKTPRSGLTCYVCTTCDSITYKYSCSGGLNATNQSGNACNNLYSECTCVEHASWNSSSGKCECGSSYKANSSGSACSLKTCDDYGYSATEDKTKNCSKQTPRSGLECWSCSACTGTLYDCGSITNANGGSGTACGGKYPSCSCKSLYRWDNGSCVLNCTRNSCSTTAYPLTAQNAANAVSYEKCTPSCSDESPRYKVASCASGYSVTGAGTSCVKTALILYSDLTTSSEVISGKTPIGVVFDEEKKLAVSLSQSSTLKWSIERFDIPQLVNNKVETALTDYNGKDNTKKIISYCETYAKSCPAAEYAYNYTTEGTISGNWYLPGFGEINAIKKNKDALNSLLADVSGDLLNKGYWTSTEYASDRAYYQTLAVEQNQVYAGKTQSVSVRPIINYGDI